MNKFESSYDPTKLGKDLLKAAGIDLNEGRKGRKNRRLTAEEIAARNNEGLEINEETAEEGAERRKKEAGTQLEIPYNEK